jgi:hypothetical protein
MKNPLLYLQGAGFFRTIVLAKSSDSLTSGINASDLPGAEFLPNPD